jgi:hypothetical protein
MTTIKTADGVLLNEGDAAYSHYTMKAGKIGPTTNAFGGPNPDPWFDFVYPDHSSDLLNGDRICSLAHAKRMGWPNA